MHEPSSTFLDSSNDPPEPSSSTAKIYLIGEKSHSSIIIQWLLKECRIVSFNSIVSVDWSQHSPASFGLASDLAPMISSKEFYQVVSKTDVIVVFGKIIDEAIGSLFQAGITNIFDGNRILTSESAVFRFMKAGGGSIYVGPTAPANETLPGGLPLRFSTERIRAKQIAPHKLFIVNSMPKSGTIWMAAMLESILGVETRKQITISHVADIESDWNKRNNHGAVALVRDMRDVVVSWFYDLQRSDARSGFEAPRYPTIEEFYWEYLIGLILCMDRYYRGNLDHWLNLLCANAIPIVKYEDMKSSPERCLKKIMNCWKVDDLGSSLKVACQEFHFDRIQDTTASERGYISDVVRSGHVRRGEVGGWKTELPARVANDIVQRFSHYQERLGYV
jgi:hypothetical protein